MRVSASRYLGKPAVGTDYKEIFITDKYGKIHIENLIVGEYTVSEVEDDKTIGYITPGDQTVKVENGNIVTAEFENILQRGSIKIEKSAEGEKDLSGFEFEISGTSLTGVAYKEAFKTDKKGIIEVKDLLVGECTIKALVNDKAESYVLPTSLLRYSMEKQHKSKLKIRKSVEIWKSQRNPTTENCLQALYLVSSQRW